MKYRRDIEGLRAIAVAIVILNHLDIPGFSGGYIGVDIFFVISGFLITSLLTHEYAENAAKSVGLGWISLRAFYFRRAKRILPVALLVLFATTVASFIIFNGVRAWTVTKDAIWAVFFLSNFHFMAGITDYFQQGFSVSPLQHYWSLAVEEQYYFLFPGIFLFAVKLHGLTLFNVKLWWNRRLIVMISFIIIISLAWSISETYNNPKGAYFSSFTRAWQLGLGALLALLVYSKQAEISLKNRHILSLVGVGLISYSCLTFNSNTLFPGFLALLPTVGAAALIAAGSNESNSPLPNKVLSLKPLTFMGRISYSLYLWHWPIIILMTYKYSQNEQSIAFRALMILVILALSILSFFLVEKPSRNIKVPKRLIENSRPKENRTPIKRFDIIKCVAFAALILTTSALIVSLTSKNTSVNLSAEQWALLENKSQGTPSQTLAPRKTYKELIAELQIEIKASSQIIKIPFGMHPSLAEISANWELGGLGKVKENFPNNPEKLAYIFGDSLADRLPYLLFSNLPADWKVVILNKSGCGIGSIPGSKSECQIFLNDAFDKINQTNPDLVVVIADHKLPDSTPSNVQALNRTFREISTGSKKTIILGNYPGIKLALVDCVTKQNEIRSNCFGRRNDVEEMNKIQKELTIKNKSIFVDTTDWFCFQDICPPIIGTTNVFLDHIHTSFEMSDKLVPIFRALLEENGVISYRN